MSGFVIKNTETGRYASKPGSERSYTKKLEEARIFLTRDEAERHLCVDNERIVPLADLLTSP